MGANLAAGNTFGAGNLGEFVSIEWYQPLGVFLASNRADRLFHVTTSGVFTDVGPTNEMRGLAVVGTQVFSINAFNDDFWEVDPNNGAILNTFALTLDGAPAIGGNGLAYDPDTGITYAVVRNTSNQRVLATIDVTTGAATTVGVLGGENFAGLTFTYIPTPAGATLLGLAGCALARRRRR